jgi:hypothetical protein
MMGIIWENQWKIMMNDWMESDFPIIFRSIWKRGQAPNPLLSAQGPLRSNPGVFAGTSAAPLVWTWSFRCFCAEISLKWKGKRDCTVEIPIDLGLKTMVSSRFSLYPIH